MATTPQFDFIIVGGGSAGCALANRLSADPGNRVLVLEAGRPDWSWDVFIHMPAALSFPIGNRFYDWRYESEPEPHMGGRRVYHARGKVLGGSSSVNGMIFQRGNPMDYERWAAERRDGELGLRPLPAVLQADGELPRGGPGRSLPRPRRSPGARAGPGPRPPLRRLLRRRAGGRLPADRRRERLPPGGVRGLRPQRAQRTPAVRGAGIPPSGHGASEPRGGDLRAGHRACCSTAKRAVGVEYTRFGRRATQVRAGEVVLCGGAINSPQLLQLSGVGAADELRPLGIDVVCDLPGVGENLQDHLEVYFQHGSTAAGVDGALLRVEEPPEGRPRVAAAQVGSRRHQPLRGGRLRAQQRRGPMAQPHVPLPADRGSLRRHDAAGRRRARIPGARGPDVLRRARHVQDRQRRPAGAPGASLQLPLDRERPARVDRGDPA